MKLRLIDRLLAALAGILLVAAAVPPLCDNVFGTTFLSSLGAQKAGGAAALMILLGAALLAVGVLCLLLALRRRSGKGFVVQTNDMGEVSISIRALEGLVNRCVEKHAELHVTSTLLENTRDGLVITLRANMASGVNIPKAVTTLQRQIKQYVTTCSGVDVYEVKVQVDATAAKGDPSAFAVPDVLENPAPLPREEAVPEVPAEPKEEKLLHQRLFGDPEEPAIVPAPPALVVDEPAQDEAEAEAVSAEEPADEVTAESGDEAEEAEKAELDLLAETTDEEYAVEEESIADLAALDGAEADDLPTDDETETEE